MIKQNKWWLLVAMTVLLTACGQRLHSTSVSYQDSGVVAVVKGAVSGSTHVRYSTATAQGRVKVNNGQFRLSVPTATHQQTITLKTGSQVVKRQLKATSSLGDYQKIAQKYRQTLIVMSLSKRMQTALQTTAATKQSATTSQQTVSNKTAVELKQAVVQADRLTKADRLPATVEGVRTVLQTKNSSVRLNVQSGQLMSVTIRLTAGALTQQSRQRLGLQLGALATACGADAQKLNAQLKHALGGNHNGGIKAQTISSHGIRFRTGTTLTDGYLLITKD